MKRNMTDIPQVWSWGATDDGQLGLGRCQKNATDVTDNNSDTVLEAKSVASFNNKCIICVAHGIRHSVYLSRDGSVHTCGFNDSGQLGQVSSANGKPSEVTALQSQVVRSISAGADFSAAVNESGQVFTWGKNNTCQLGREGSETSVKVVRDLLQDGHQVCQVTCGREHVLALCRDAALISWGSNTYGQLGTGEQHGRKESDVEFVGCTPKKVSSLSGLPVRQISAGGWHSILLSWSGAVYAWGRNERGQLGIGANSAAHEWWPVQVRTLRSQKVKQVSSGEEHTAALTHEGGVFTFGAGDSGQLGHGGTGNELLPRKVFELMGTGICQVACGRRHTLALAADNRKLYAFGLGAAGQLGTGLTIDKSGPATVRGPWTLVTPKNTFEPLSVYKIFAGGDHSSVIAHGVSASLVPLERHHWSDFPVQFDLQLAQDLELSVKKTPVSETEPEGLSALLRRLEIVLSSISCLCSSFLATDTHFNASRHNSGVDLDLASCRFSALREAAAKHPSIQNMCLDSITRRLLPALSPNFCDVEVLRIFLLLPACHLFDDATLMQQVHTPYALAWLQLAILRVWISNLSPRHFARVVRSFKAAVVHLLGLPRGQNEFEHLSKERSMRASLDLLKFFNEANSDSPIVPYHFFYIHELTEKVDIEADFLNWVSQNKRNPEGGGPMFSFCSYPFIFDGQAKSVLLRLDARLQMQNAVRTAQQRNFLAMMSSPVAYLGIDPVNPLLVLVVRRDHLLVDALTELSRHSEADFKKPLKVVFSQEEAVDEGGPTKEFFLLILREILSPVYGMFKLHEDSRFLWFNSETFDTDLMYYHLIGVLCGLAIYNNIVVDLCFPLALFKLLLSKPVTLEDYKELEPTIGKSLQDLLDYDSDDLEDVFPLNFEISVESYGSVRAVQLKENGSEISVTSENRQEYVKLYVQWVFQESCESQFKAFSNGFHKVCGGDVLNLFQPAELQAMVVGNEDYDWDELENGCTYKGEYWAKHPTIKIFWEVFKDLNIEQKKKFLLFLTGCDKVPIYGMKAIKITIQPTGGGDQYLPVAHTCYNLLDLPKYSDKETLRKKLTLAIEQSEGFALV